MSLLLLTLGYKCYRRTGSTSVRILLIPAPASVQLRRPLVEWFKVEAHGCFRRACAGTISSGPSLATEGTSKFEAFF